MARSRTRPPGSSSGCAPQAACSPRRRPSSSPGPPPTPNHLAELLARRVGPGRTAGTRRRAGRSSAACAWRSCAGASCTGAGARSSWCRRRWRSGPGPLRRGGAGPGAAGSALLGCGGGRAAGGRRGAARGRHRPGRGGYARRNVAPGRVWEGDLYAALPVDCAAGSTCGGRTPRTCRPTRSGDAGRGPRARVAVALEAGPTDGHPPPGGGRSPCPGCAPGGRLLIETSARQSPRSTGLGAGPRRASLAEVRHDPDLDGTVAAGRRRGRYTSGGIATAPRASP